MKVTQIEASSLAYMAHHDQLDLAGQPYIRHVTRVARKTEILAAAFYPIGPYPDDTYMQVAWLHDVIEDTFLDAEHLGLLGFAGEVTVAVSAMSRLPEERYYQDFIPRCCDNRIARWVKLADVRDHLEDRGDGFVLHGAQKSRYLKSEALLAEACGVTS